MFLYHSGIQLQVNSSNEWKFSTCYLKLSSKQPTSKALIYARGNYEILNNIKNITIKMYRL